MLTKSDLSELRNIIREELEVENDSIKNDILAEIKFARIELETKINKLEKKAKDTEIHLKKIRKDISTIISYFDRGYISIRKKVERIEEHLGFSA